MTARDAAFLGCRLMALWFGVNGLIQLPIAMAGQAYFARMDSRTRGLLEQFIESAPLYWASASLVIAAILFYGAVRFSGALVRDPEIEFKPMSHKSLLITGAALIGLYTAARFLPGLVQSLFETLSNEAKSRTDPSTLVANVVGLGLAVTFFVSAVWWARKDTLQERDS